LTLAAKNVEARRVEERESRVRRLRAAAVPYLLLLPAVLALAAVSLYPTLDGIRASLDRFRYGQVFGPDKWLAIVVILAAQTYLLLAPASGPGAAVGPPG